MNLKILLVVLDNKVYPVLHETSDCPSPTPLVIDVDALGQYKSEQEWLAAYKEKNDVKAELILGELRLHGDLDVPNLQGRPVDYCLLAKATLYLIRNR